MSHRGFSFDKLKSKVTGRRSSESSIFEIGKSKSGERRNSVSNPMIIIEESALEKSQTGSVGVRSGRHGSLSMSVTNGIPTDRTRSISTGRNVSKKQTKELIKQETAQVILKKLLHVLLELGLQQPIPLNTTNSSLSGPVSKSAKMYVANTHDCIYLSPASSASFTYEDVENGGIPQDRIDTEVLDLNTPDEEVTPSDDDPNSKNSLISLDPNVDDTTVEGMEPPERLREKMESFNSPNYLCTKIDSDSPIPHTFAVIIELKKETIIKDVNFEFQSMTNILWPTYDPYNKSFVKEKFKIGYMEWQAKMSDAFFYINTSNSNDVKTKKVTPEKLADITRNYKLISVRDLADGTDNYNQKGFSRKSSVQFDRDESDNSQNTSYNTSNTNNDLYKEGIYVFLLPILLPEHIPPSITTINGSLAHILNVNMNKISAKLNRKVKVTGSYNLPMVRTPPLHANSIADKPIYVDRVWNDSLHYVITFPKKYVSLGSEHSINVKLIPLVKDVVIKRIKFNISERITYVSKNLSKEYDYDGDDPFHVNANNDRVRERLISVCELRTKNKSSNSNSEPYKEEFIKCPDNNLLFSCYEQQLSDEDIENLNLDDPLSKPPNNDSRDLLIASPLAINVALPFLTTRSDKTILTSSINDGDTHIGENDSSSTSRKASIAVNDPTSPPFTTPSSPIIGTLETNLTHNDFNVGRNEVQNETITPDASAFMTEDSHNYLKENIQQGYTTVSKALYPDSNFRHIQIHHRLQVCFRISKPDPKDNFKMHHYEVVVDTPLVLLSAKCNDESIQLPKYDEIDLPIEQRQAMERNTKPSIPFRTPNYENNGVSIKPLNDDTELLPSFEEAISSPSSPVTRSISLGEDQVSRIPSIIPDEPAPAYEAGEDTPGQSHNVFNIDSIVDGVNSPSTNLRRSAIRCSLVNSFAPSSSNNDTGNNDLGSDVPASSRLESDVPKNEANLVISDTMGSTDNISTTPTSSSNSTNLSGSSGISGSSGDSIMYTNELDNQTVPDTSGTETSQTDTSNAYKDNHTDNTSEANNANYCGVSQDISYFNETQVNNRPLIQPHSEKLNNVGISNDQLSVLTNFNFDQRLPLLENSSVDDVNYNIQSSITYPNEASNNTAVYHDKRKRSNENLAMIMDTNEAQDIYRAI